MPELCAEWFGDAKSKIRILPRCAATSSISNLALFDWRSEAGVFVVCEKGVERGEIRTIR